MRIEKRDGSRERRIVTGMIVDPLLLGRVAPKWTSKGGMFASPWANVIGKWCVDHYTKYNQAPGKAIQGIFEAWAESHPNKENIKGVDKLLSELSNEYERLAKESNSQLLIDMAEELFNRIQAAKCIEKAQGHLDIGEVTKAIKTIKTFQHVEMSAGAGVDVLSDKDAIRSMFAKQTEALVTYPGALGQFFGNDLCRGGFISFMGPDKVGKSFWLMDIGVRAMKQRKRVAFFQLGDLSQDQAMARFAPRILRHPMTSQTGWPCEVEIPKSIELLEDGKAIVNHEKKVFKKPLTEKEVIEGFEKVMKDELKTKDSYLKLSTHPASTLTVDGMVSILDTWERDGWVADMIIADYADLFAPAPGYSESRDAVNANWKKLSALRLERQCCVVVATQTNAEAYRGDHLGKWNFSEDKRKNAHVTGMIGLNQKDNEKSDGITRLNWIVLRNRPFNSNRFWHVAGCLALANPAVRSCGPLEKKS